jgi:hypothetical protein
MKKILLASLVLGIATEVQAQSISFEKVSKTDAPIVGLGYGGVVFVDIDHDGDQDVIIGGEEYEDTKHTSMYINDGTGKFKFKNSPLEKLGDQTIVVGDIDSDGYIDVIQSGYSSDSSKTITNVFKNDGTGVLIKFEGSNLPGVEYGPLMLEDIDYDGDLDVFLFGSGTGVFGGVKDLYLNDGTGVFTLSTETFKGVKYNGGYANLADVDNDGYKDLILVGDSVKDDNTVALFYINNGRGKFTLDTRNEINAGQYPGIGFGDVDNDGDLDMFLQGQISSGDLHATLFLNDGTGLFTPSTTSTFNTCYGGYPRFWDIDQDGDLDLLYSGSSDEFQTYIYQNNGSGTFTEVTGVPLIKVYNRMNDIADIDGDGDLDLIIAGRTEGRKHQTEIYKNTSKTVSIKETNTASFHVYPNPVKNQLNVQFSEVQSNIHVKMFDVLGRIVFEQQQKNTSIATFECKLTAGIYFVSISNDVETAIKQVVIE